jgi:hypothetical protein
MATPVARNHAESVLREKKHLAVPSVGPLAGGKLVGLRLSTNVGEASLAVVLVPPLPGWTA